ncbi:lysozyme family protein [Pseudaminobacter sp. NGMCC 1.201702]|uniref:hypothetical protein n=1 Tax=Pseudaminobacter sp. NGMCC 1.201702 TaxID=3391825 RepID=UPI0039F07CA6
MDKTVPSGAAILLDFIRKTEVGTAEPRGYDVIYANKQAHLPKPITRMTVAELQAHQSKGWPAKSTASGGYQFMRATLAGLRKELGLRDGQIFDADLQDRLGFHLLKRRGYESFMAGKISAAEFGKRLAMEWASFPVLAATKGAHRQLKRGQSYYAGDGLNKALVAPEVVEAMIERAWKAGNKPVANKPAAPKPTTKPTTGPAFAAVLLIAAAAALFLIFGT